MRRLRRSRGRRDADRFDAFYRVYITGLLGVVGFYLALGLVDEATVDARGVTWAEERGPLWLSVVTAVVIAAAARSGANGGPLAIDDVDVHHTWLSPLDRSTMLARPTRRLVITAAGLAGVLGAAAGELASRQLPGNQAEWVLAGLLTGVAISLTGVATALVAAGATRPRMIARLAFLAPVWAVVDLATGTATSPTSGYGQLALWPLDPAAAAATGLAIPLLLTAWGWRRRGAASIERVQHRSRLVRQIRFALAQQDIRGLLLLRRQLGFETPRVRPWLAIRGGGRFEARYPVAVRDARSYMRWPAVRVARVAGLATVGGLALAAMWEGTTALIGVVGAALYIAAIEVIEPLSQELDHPGILELIPTTMGKVMLAHALAAVAAMTMLWTLVGSVATLATLDWRVGATTAIAAVPASAAAVAAATLSIKRFDTPTLAPSPEVEGPQMLVRLLWPPALTLFGAIPFLAARNALADNTPLVPATVNATALVALVATLALLWIRFRDETTDAADRTGSTAR